MWRRRWWGVVVFWEVAWGGWSRERRREAKSEHARRVNQLWQDMKVLRRAGGASEAIPNPINSRLKQSALVQRLYYDIMKLSTGAHEVRCLRSLSGLVEEPSVFDSAARARVADRGLFSLGASGVRVAEVAWPPGQRGAVATRDLPARTVVGQYVGDEWLDFEFRATFPEEAASWYYALVLNYEDNVKEGAKVKRGARSKIPRKGVPVPKDVAVVVDALCGPRGPVTPVAFVNDCRANITDPRLTAEDLSRRNAEFVYCVVDHSAVFPFLVTLKPLKQGDQLYAYYGPAHTLDAAQLNHSLAFMAEIPDPPRDENHHHQTEL